MMKTMDYLLVGFALIAAGEDGGGGVPCEQQGRGAVVEKAAAMCPCGPDCECPPGECHCGEK